MRTLLLSAVAAALLHITPTVILVKRPDAVKQLLPDAEQFFARELHLSNVDAHRLHQSLDWSPEDGVLTFYTGKAGGKDVGTLLFVRVDSPHGPVEIAVSFTPQRIIRGVVVTKATVETKPWVAEALRGGLVEHYRGLKSTDDPGGAGAIKAQVGELADYIAGEIDKGVRRALVAMSDFAA